MLRGVASQNPGSEVITGGTIDNTVIGGTTPAAGTFYPLNITSTTGTAETLGTFKTAYSNPSGNKSFLWTDATSPLARISVSYSAPNSSMSFGSFYSSGYLTADTLVLSAAGAAVTGTLSATGNITGSSKIGAGAAPTTYPLESTTALTGTNPGDNTTIFLTSLASGRDTNIRFSDSVNSSVRIGYIAGDFYVYTNGAERFRVSTAGATTVTGTLAVTGAVSIGNTVTAAIAVASTNKVAITIGGVPYFLLATT